MRPIKSVEDLQPLLDFYASTMGELPGQLMAALSLLADLEYTEGWDKTAPEARLSVKLAGALVADVFKRLVAAQPEADWKAEAETMLAKWAKGEGGKEAG